MSLLHENIRFASDECFRLLRWEDNTENLEMLEAGGHRVAVPGMGWRWHHHPEVQITLFLRGSGLRYVGDHVGPFAAMDCVLLGSHLPHCWMEHGRTQGFMVQFHLPPEHPLRKAGGAQELQRLLTSSERGLHFHPTTAQAALELMERMAAASKLARAGLLLELLALLHDAPRKHSRVLSKARFFAGAAGGAAHRLESVVQWLLEHFTEPLTLEQVVQRSAMSRATFCRQFVKHTGKSFITFINDARLAHAHQMLGHKDLTITEIAYDSGFGSLSRFNAAFREKFGKAPREIRRA